MSGIYVTVQNTQYTATVDTPPSYEASVASGSNYTVVAGGYVSNVDSGWIETTFYPRSNPSGYLPVNLGGLSDGDVITYVASLQQWTNAAPVAGGSGASTGWVDLYYYPRTNPSGFITGSAGAVVNTGELDARYVHLTGNETISGIKTFATGIQVNRLTSSGTNNLIITTPSQLGTKAGEIFITGGTSSYGIGYSHVTLQGGGGYNQPASNVYVLGGNGTLYGGNVIISGGDAPQPSSDYGNVIIAGGISSTRGHIILTGNVGIGVWNPTRPFQVNGEVYVQGSGNFLQGLYVNGIPVVTGNISGASEAWVNSNYYPRTNPSGFTPKEFGVNFSIQYSGSYVTGILYENGNTTQMLFSGTSVTGIQYPTYKKQILYSGTTITGVKFI